MSTPSPRMKARISFPNSSSPRRPAQPTLCPSRERPTATFSSAPPRCFSNPLTCLRGPLERGSITTKASPRVVSCKRSLIFPSNPPATVPSRKIPRFRRPPPLRCGGRSGWRLLSPTQDCPGGGAVAVFHLERQADQLVLAWPYPRQIQAFDDPDPGTEERLMRLDAVFPEPADRKVVDADGPGTCRLRRRTR